MFDFFVCLSAVSATQTGPRYAPFYALIALTFSFAIWFICCFTGDPDAANRKRQSFIFAYVFTITSFSVLLFPMTSPWQPDITGPISLIRGCVDPKTDKSVPDSIVCIEGERKITFEAAVSAAAGPSSTSLPPIKPMPPKAEKPAASSGVPGEVGVQKPTVRTYTLPPDFSEITSYPWLVVVGGTYGAFASETTKKAATGTSPGGTSPGGTSPGGTSPGGTSPGGTSPGGTSPGGRSPGGTSPGGTSPGGTSPGTTTTGAEGSESPIVPSYSIVQGGFAVPYYIVLLAFIGAAVSLTRRIPEYQKQSEPGYIPTTDAPALTSWEARENVVFEIMQLVTAPFIAMVAFYAFAPSTTASGVTLAFLSGFSSSLVLLQLRGMLEGLYPASTAKISQPASTLAGLAALPDLSGTVFNKQNQPVAGATVSVQGHPNVQSSQTDVKGQFVLKQLPTGIQTLEIVLAGKTESIAVRVLPGTNNPMTVIFDSAENLT
jgi:hypothetical protein